MSDVPFGVLRNETNPLVEVYPPQLIDGHPGFTMVVYWKRCKLKPCERAFLS
jgi:hypothetical protein